MKVLKMLSVLAALAVSVNTAQATVWLQDTAYCGTLAEPKVFIATQGSYLAIPRQYHKGLTWLTDSVEGALPQNWKRVSTFEGNLAFERSLGVNPYAPDRAVCNTIKALKMISDE